MTVNELAVQLAKEQDEDSNDTEFISVVESWIDDAVDEIASSHDWRFFKKIRPFSTVISQRAYPLDEDIVDIRSIRFIDTDEPIDYQDEMNLANIAEDLENQGKPRWWYFTNTSSGVNELVKNIAFSPIPAAIYPLELSVYVHPTTIVLDTTDPIPFRKEWILAIKHRVRAYVLMSDKDYEGATKYLQMFYQKLEDMKTKENQAPAGRFLVMQPRDLGQQNDRRFAKLDPSRFRN